MPPRKRKRPTDQPTPSPQAVNTSNTTLSSSPFSAPDDTDAPPFLNTTFTTHRASPLHLGDQPLTQPRLHTLSQRLRDLLVGDVVRGLELGLDRSADNDPAMRRAGALEVVSLGWVRLEGLLGRYVSGTGADSDPDTSASTVDGVGGSLGRRRALQITLQYENAECVALLLPAVGHSLDEDEVEAVREEPGVEESGAGFLHLPLLLLRMPAPLRGVLCGFISRTFDCRISALSLGTKSLVGALEGWLSESRVPTVGSFAKDVVVTLGFYAPTVTAHQAKQQKETGVTDSADEDVADSTRTTADPAAVGIKAIDIIIPNADLRRFVRAGRAQEAAAAATRNAQDRPLHEENPYGARKRRRRRRLGGDKDEEAWTWRHPAIRPQPFTEALARYVREHLALDMFHPAVRVTKIACGGFVLSEGRVKIFGIPPSTEGEDGNGLAENGQRAVWTVFEGLGERARIRPLEKTLGLVG